MTMKKRLISFSLAAAMCAVFCPPAFAEILMQEKIDVAENKCNFTVETGEADKMIAFKVYNKTTGQIVYLSDKITDSEGKASFSFYNEAEEGTYVAVAKRSDTGEIAEKQFEQNPEAMKELLNGIADAVKDSDAEALAALLLTMADGAYIDTSMYSSELTEEEFAAISARYIKLADSEAIRTGTMETAAESFYKSVAVVNAASKQPAVTLADMLENQNIRKALGVDEQSPVLDGKIAFEAVTNTQQKNIISDVFGKEYKDVESFVDALILKTITNIIETPDSYLQIEDFLEAYGEKKLISLDVYDDLSNTKANKLLQDMCKRSFSDYADIEKYIKNYTEKNSSGSSSGSGGSGSGGTSAISSANVSTSVTQTPVTGATDNSEMYEPKYIFKDMDNYRWAIEATEYLYEHGVVHGVGEDMFAPAKNVTRAEFVKIITETIGIEDTGEEIPFKDVDKDHWSYSYVAAAYNSGIVMGIEDDLFGRDQYVTRQEAAVILERVMKTYDPNRPTFPAGEYDDLDDIDTVSPWAVDAVNYLHRCEIVSGKTMYEFMPHDAMTRAETTVFIYKYLNVIGRKVG